eukprot:scaffold7.g3556.t1
MERGGKQPPRKKQRIMEVPPLAFSRLASHAVDFGEGEVLSPGAHFSCRVAVAALPGEGATAYEVYAASRHRIFCLVPPRQPGAAAFAGERGKEGAYIPTPGAGLAAQALPQIPHRAEVQDLRLWEGGDGAAVLASVDCYGRAVLAHLRRGAWGDGGGGGGGQGVTGEGAGGGQGGYELAELHQVQPTDLLREAGWAGVAVAPGAPAQAAVARHFAKDVTLFDGPLPTRTIHTLYSPNDLHLLSSALAPAPGGGPLVAVVEGPQVSLWDARGGGRGTRVARLGPGPHSGPLYALAVSDNCGQPLLGTAGHDRGVLVYDPRKWSLLHRWGAALKYEATQLHFASAAPAHAVVAGLDYEVLCGQWAGNKGRRLGNNTQGAGAGQAPVGRAVGPQPRADGEEEAEGGGCGRGLSFRGDARWLGLAKAQGQDVLAGLTNSGQLYMAELAIGTAATAQQEQQE